MAGSLILDTHVWFWFAETDRRLDRSSTLSGIHAALGEGRLAVSVISIWELAMLESKRRLSLRPDARRWIEDALALPGLQLWQLTPEIALTSTRLPGNLHGDPADRMIVASALQHRASLITADERLIEYARQGHVNVLPV